MNKVVDYLQDLIRIPSASSLSNRGVIEYAQNALHQAGWTSALSGYVDSSGVEKLNLIAAPPGQDPQEPVVDLALLCHTDTVPPAGDWAAALAPFFERGMVHGCGACDVKGFLACLLEVAHHKPVEGFRPGLRIVLTADEEIGCLGSHRLLSEGKLRPRTLIIGEPTSLHPARAGKGYCLAEMTIFGAEAHSAHPRQGRSAIYDAARVIQAIERLAERLMQEADSFFDPPYTTINVGTIQGGTAKNVVPAECRFLIEWRPVPKSSPAAVPGAIQRILDEMSLADAGFKYQFTVLRQQPGFETDSHAKLVMDLERLTGKSAIAIPFGSEASVFPSIAEETIVFGPGDMHTAHSPRECVPASELEEAVRCLNALLTDRI